MNARHTTAATLASIGFVGALLCGALFGASAEAKTSVQNNISVSSNTGGNTADGGDGADGRDGKDGKDGEDGVVIEGNSKSSVSVETIIDGEVVESYEKTVENGETVSERRIHETDNARVETDVELSAGSASPTNTAAARRAEPATQAESDAFASDVAEAIANESIISQQISQEDEERLEATTSDDTAGGMSMFAAVRTFFTSIVAYVAGIFS